MDEVTAPDLLGLMPDDARLVCYEQDLAVAIRVADMVEVRGWDPARVRVAQQWPPPGSRVEPGPSSCWSTSWMVGMRPVSESLDGRPRRREHPESHPMTSQRAAATATEPSLQHL